MVPAGRDFTPQGLTEGNADEQQPRGGQDAPCADAPWESSVRLCPPLSRMWSQPVMPRDTPLGARGHWRGGQRLSAAPRHKGGSAFLSLRHKKAVFPITQSSHQYFKM